MQPRTTSGKAVLTPEEIVKMLAQEMQSELPKNLDLEKSSELTFAETEPGVINSLGVFIKQEILRFNVLLKVIRLSLGLLQQAIDGTYVMTMELEKMFNMFLDGKVPANWSDAGYPCLKPLASWMKDLIKRIEFVSGWLYNGPPNTYWVPSFFFPQGFMTASL